MSFLSSDKLYILCILSKSKIYEKDHITPTTWVYARGKSKIQLADDDNVEKTI